jgi:UDP-glucose 4-epimerase
MSRSSCHFLNCILCSYFCADCSCLENLDEIKNYPNYKFVKGNICSSELVSYVLEAEKIDTIMHFAAQTHVDNSFGNSFQFTQVRFCVTMFQMRKSALALLLLLSVEVISMLIFKTSLSSLDNRCFVMRSSSLICNRNYYQSHTCDRTTLWAPMSC